MAEIEGEHRRSLQDIAIRNVFLIMSRGQIFALIVALFGLAVAAEFAWFGNPATGAIVAGGSLVTIVTAFLKGDSKAPPPPTLTQEQPTKQDSSNKK